MRKTTLLGIAVLGVFSVLGFAQHDHEGTSGPAPGGPKMGAMMENRDEMSRLMTQMMESMRAINEEKDPAKLKALLAEHTTLMEQMREKMGAMKGQMKDCPMMGKDN